MKPILSPSDISNFIEYEYKAPDHQIYYSAQLILIFIRNIVFIVAFAIENIKLKNKISHLSVGGTNKNMNENKIKITLRSVKNNAELDSAISSIGISPKRNTDKTNGNQETNDKQECVLQNTNTKYYFEVSIQFPVVSLDSITHSSTLNSGGRELDSNGFEMMKSLNKLLCAIHGNGYRETKNALIFTFPNYSNDKILNTATNHPDANMVLNSHDTVPDGTDSLDNEFDCCCACVVDCADNIPAILLQGLKSLKVKVFNIVCDDTKHLARIEYTKIFKQCDIVMIQQFDHCDFIKDHLQYKGKIIYYGIMDALIHSANTTFDHTICHPIDSVQIGLLVTYLSRNMKSKSEVPNEVTNGTDYFGQNKRSTIYSYANKICTKCVLLLKNLSILSRSSDHVQGMIHSFPYLSS